VTDKQHITRTLQLREAPEQIALRFLVEIDDDIAAEDDS
jgi:hypothetical protein